MAVSSSLGTSETGTLERRSTQNLKSRVSRPMITTTSNRSRVINPSKSTEAVTHDRRSSRCGICLSNQTLLPVWQLRIEYPTLVWEHPRCLLQVTDAATSCLDYSTKFTCRFLSFLTAPLLSTCDKSPTRVRIEIPSALVPLHPCLRNVMPIRRSTSTLTNLATLPHFLPTKTATRL
jgi:hypothetical protein